MMKVSMGLTHIIYRMVSYYQDRELKIQLEMNSDSCFSWTVSTTHVKTCLSYI